MNERAKLGLVAGDTVRVSQKIEEKGKTRLQVFEGLVLARKHGNEPGATFVVRKVASGVGVEKIFPLYSPIIDKIEIIKRAKVRRAKLYYIRDKAAKEVKRQMRRAKVIHIATESETEAQVTRDKKAQEAAVATKEIEVAENASAEKETTEELDKKSEEKK